MPMQQAILALVELGRLPSTVGVPDADMPTIEWLKAFESNLDRVRTPVSVEEAQALAELLGPDDCFGLAWTVVTTLETAPGWLNSADLTKVDPEWRPVLEAQRALDRDDPEVARRAPSDDIDQR
jgi:hypothetical protein